MTSVEALVRWRHPERGFVPPGEFIPFAEQTGYISAITRWVVHARRGTVRRVGSARACNMRVCVNVSARDLRSEDTLVQYVSGRAASRPRCRPRCCASRSPRAASWTIRASAQSTLRKLRDLGIATSIDDYGTGYSSLAYIKQLAVNELKIDRTFVAGMEADRRNAAIVRSTIELGHNLGLTVVAEGVETEHELEELRRFGCDVVQGFYFARPMAADALESWLGGARDRGSGIRTTTTRAIGSGS